MNTLTPEQLELQAAAAEFARAELGLDLQRRDRDEVFDRDGWNRCADFGVMRMPVPEEYGGLGQGMTDLIAVMEGLGYGSADNGLLFSIHAHMWTTVMPIVAYGTEAQKERYLPKLISGEWIGANAASEPDAGSDVFSMRTVARRDDDTYVLDGTKMFVSNAKDADVYVLYATIDRALGATGVTGFIVDAQTPGLSIGRPMEKMGLRTSTMAEVVLEGCRIPAEARLGRLDAAVSTLGKAVRRYPGDPTVYAALGRVWLDQATNESDETALAKALEALQLAAASPAATGESLGLYGRVLLLSGDLQGAERILEQARSRLPIDPARLLDLASVSEALGHLAAARSALMDYAALAPAGRASPSMLKVARLSLALDDGPTAVTWARRAVSESSATADALGLLAEALWHTGHGDEALDILGQALERDPDNEALADLGRRFSARRRGATHRLSDPRSAIARASDGTAFEAKTDEQLQQALPR